METARLDHIALHPRLEASTLVEAVVLPLYFLLCEFRFVDPRSVIPVPTDTPVAGGWFVAGDSFDSHGIVTTGAQALLSQETAGPAEEE